MKKIIRTALFLGAGLLVLHGPALAATGGYYIGADSKQALEQARKADPDNYAVNYFLGQIYLAEGNRDGAINAWNAYLAAAPDDGRSVAVRERMTLLKLARAREFAKKAAATGGTPPARPPANTIAVTDFKNLGTAKLAPFIKGLTAMIISDLAKVPQVRVLERAKIQALMQEMQLGLASGLIDARTAPKLGKMVQARKVAWGRMGAPDSTRLKITSIVTEILENTTLKQTDAEGAMAQFFKLQKQLVFGILEGMGIRKEQLPDRVRKAVEKVHTTSIDALVQFGMGVGFLDNKDFAQAKQAFGKAAKIDPEFDLAGEAEVATPVSDVPVTSDGATEEVAMSTAGTGEKEDDEAEAADGTATGDTGDDTSVSTSPSTAETSTMDTTTVTDTTTDTSQTVTTAATATTTHAEIGYAIFMLEYNSGSPPPPRTYSGTYRNTTPQDHESPSVSGTSIAGSGTATYNPVDDTITALTVPGGVVVDDSGLPYPLHSNVIGDDSYMEWGSFNVVAPGSTPPMVEGTFYHTVDTLGYYVGGDLTTTDQMSTLATNLVTASYSGTPYATIWTAGGGITIPGGTFSMDVDFHTGAISNFLFNANTGAGNPHVLISGASGSITSDANYTINTGTGFWEVYDGSNTDNGAAVFDRDGRGSFYGTDAHETGGIVGMTGSTAGAAAGMYQGHQ